MVKSPRIGTSRAYHTSFQNYTLSTTSVKPWCLPLATNKPEKKSRRNLTPYVSALDSNLAAIAILLLGWDLAVFLHKKMELSVLAPNKLEQLNQLQGKPTPYSMKTPTLALHASPKPMDLDAITTKPLHEPPSARKEVPPFLANYRQEGKQQGLC